MNLRCFPPCLALVLVLSLTAQAQAPSAAPALVEPKDVFAGVPREVIKDLKPGSANLTTAMAQADKQVRSNLKDKPGTFQIKVLRTEQLGTGYAIVAVLDEVRVNGTPISVEYTIMPDPSQNMHVAKIKPGDRVKASGNVFAMMLGGQRPVLRLEMYKAVLLK